MEFCLVHPRDIRVCASSVCSLFCCSFNASCRIAISALLPQLIFSLRVVSWHGETSFHHLKNIENLWIPDVEHMLNLLWLYTLGYTVPCDWILSPGSHLPGRYTSNGIRPQNIEYGCRYFSSGFALCDHDPVAKKRYILVKNVTYISGMWLLLLSSMKNDHLSRGDVNALATHAHDRVALIIGLCIARAVGLSGFWEQWSCMSTWPRIYGYSSQIRSLEASLDREGLIILVFISDNMVITVREVSTVPLFQYVEAMSKS